MSSIDPSNWSARCLVMSRLEIIRRSTTWKRSMRSSEAAAEIPSSTRQAASSRRTSRKPCFTRFSPSSKRLRSRRCIFPSSQRRGICKQRPGYRAHRRLHMIARWPVHIGVVAVTVAILFAFSPVEVKSQRDTAGAVTVGAGDLGGVVTGTKGPQAGVWVIAETNDLPTKLAKVVVTDDQGRYLIPDLPKANYSVWTRGYGLVDSPKVSSTPGQTLNLTAVVAPSTAAAAEYYPGMYWYSMLKIPAKSEFPGTGDKGNGISANIKTQEAWVDTVKNACQSCHSLGSKGMRAVPKEFGGGIAGWARRTQSGQAMSNMALGLGYMGAEAALKNYADSSGRGAAGGLPFAKPERPQGLERNMVVTMWDFSTPKYYLHDGISTDRDNPRLNANGPIYGAPEESTDLIPALDPVTHTASQIKHPVPNPKTPSSTDLPMQPSAYWGKEPIWDGHSSIHNAMMDSEGRVWFSARIRPAANPDFCKKGSDHPSAKVFPLETSGRQITMYDPKTEKFTMINTCYPTHHLQFGFDANNTLWASAGGPASGAAGWLNVKMLEETGDEVKSQGWTPFILDTNGDGKRGEYTEPNQPFDPNKDRRIQVAFYGASPSRDGTVWGTSLGFPGYVVRLDPTKGDPSTASLAEIYEFPAPG